MGYRLLKVETLKGGLSEAVLAEHSALPDIPGERELKKPRIRYLSERAEVGDFNRCEWARCHCKETGLDYRVNGNHSKAVLQSILDGEIEAEWPEGIPVTVQWYECDTLTDLGDVFDQFDNQKSARKPEDKLGVYIAQHSDLIGIDKKLIGKVLTGVDWAAKHVPEVAEACAGHRPESAYDRGVMLNIDVVRDFIDTMSEYSGASFNAWESKSGILAAVFRRYLLDRKSAEVMIEQTMNEIGDECEAYTSAMRKACTRTGKDQGYFYRATEKHLKNLAAAVESLGVDAVKAMIREVLAEQQEEVDLAAD